MDLRKYVPLFKLRICALITLSAVVGFVSAPAAVISWNKMFLLAISTMAASAAASAFNHYFDSDIDAVMRRTRKRPLPSGEVASSKGILLAATLLFTGSILFSFKTLNYAAGFHLFLGGFVYVVLYTVWLKRRSWTNIIIGGLAGSFAVLAGGASSTPG
ncbi:MAG: UbiA family prenyltransferase, partial [Deltaproteobacteria bacterium]|nr:UbiA family prenyltransferase [Deltaproteobacteria bacterium]